MGYSIFHDLFGKTQQQGKNALEKKPPFKWKPVPWLS